MTKKEFMRKVSQGNIDLIEEFIAVLRKEKIPFCVIGGLAVNAYAEPVVSLDMDVVIIAERIEDLMNLLKQKYKVKRYLNSINIMSAYSDIRIQIQTDERYQSFIQRSHKRNVMGYVLPVASVEDVLQGKIWAALDEERRPSKRQKDLADIMRLVEAKPELISLVPFSLKRKF